MTGKAPSPGDKQRLRAHFGFTHMPFSKYAWAKQMFDSVSQRELLHGLLMWLEIGGISLLTGPTGVGKSITLRRFVGELDDTRFRVIHFTQLPTTTTGFLRSLNRQLGLPMRLHTADLFDQAHKHLATHEQERGTHPLLIIDDAEGIRTGVADMLRRLTSYELNGEGRFSILLAGTEDLLSVLLQPELAPLCSRIFYAHPLRPFGLEDARNYIRYHLERADVDPKTLSDDAVKRVFQASHGTPRLINQLSLQALIQAAVLGRVAIDGDFMASVIKAHPLFHNGRGARR